MAVSKASQTKMELRDSVREHPSWWSMAGGLAGLGISSLLVRRFKQRDAERLDAGWRRDPQYGFTSDGFTTDGFTAGLGDDARHGGRFEGTSDGSEHRGKPDKVAWAKAAAHDLKEQGREVAHNLKEKGHETAHDLKARGHNLKERASGDGGGGNLKERGHALKERGVSIFHEREAQLRDRGSELKHRVEEDPIPLVIGALAIGAIAAFLLPISNRERELSGPLTDRVRGRLDTLKGEASSRLGQVREQASESFSSFREQATETLKGSEEDHREFGMPNAHDASMRH